MSILIKGMKMPPTCRYCEFERIGQFGGEWCALTKTDIPRKPIKRLKDCPLAEVVMPNIVHWLNDIEIVRCHDCKHKDGHYCHNKDGFAEGNFVRDDDYCSRGELELEEVEE